MSVGRAGVFSLKNFSLLKVTQSGRTDSSHNWLFRRTVALLRPEVTEGGRVSGSLWLVFEAV